MDMPKEFYDMVCADIERLSNTQNLSDDERLKLHREIDGKYQTSLDKGTQRKTTENELPSLTQCTA